MTDFPNGESIEILFTPSAVKQLEQLPPTHAFSIMTAIKDMSDPHSKYRAQSSHLYVGGESPAKVWRVRVEPYRILIEENLQERWLRVLAVLDHYEQESNASMLEQKVLEYLGRELDAYEIRPRIRLGHWEADAVCYPKETFEHLPPIVVEIVGRHIIGRYNRVFERVSEIQRLIGEQAIGFVVAPTNTDIPRTAIHDNQVIGFYNIIKESLDLTELRSLLKEYKHPS